MSDFAYASTDDFQKAAARILKIASDGLVDAELRLSSEGFFRRPKLAAALAPSQKMLQAFCAPADQAGAGIVGDPQAAESYCRSVREIVSEHVRRMGDADVSARRMASTLIEQMRETTSEVLTKESHDDCWNGGEGLAHELRPLFAA